MTHCLRPLSRAALAVALVVFCTLSPAQNWPAKPIQILAPASPGGGVDFCQYLVRLPA